MRALVNGFIVGLPLAASAAAQSPTPADSLKRFIQSYPGPDEGTSTRSSAALADLNGDGIQEAIVHLTSQNWCGSGGCTAARGQSESVTSVAPGQPDDRLDVEGLWKQIHHGQPLNLVAFFQSRQIPRQRGRIARHNHDLLRTEFQQTCDRRRP